MDKIADIRRANLRRLIDRDGLSSVAKRSGKPDRQLNDMVAGRKSFGERVARDIEHRFDPSRPRGWLDTEDAIRDPHHADEETKSVVKSRAKDDEREDGFVRLEHLSPRPTMGQGAAVTEPVRIVQYLDVAESWVREEIGSVTPARVKVLTAVGRSMLPTIQDRDLVFVDLEHRHFDAPGIYVIDVAGRFLLKKVMMLADGTVVIRSDNTEEFPDEERYPLDQAGEIVTICGKVLGWWTLRKS